MSMTINGTGQANGRHTGGAPRVGLLVSHLREEEKLLLAAGTRRGIEVVVLQDRSLILDLSNPSPPAVDVVLDRCVAHTRGSCILRVFDRWGIPTINSSQAAAVCDDKVEMSVALALAGVPALRTAVAFSISSAQEIGERFGYPVVVKPTTGSWGRLLARANSPAALKTILEQKQQFGSPHHSIFYIQEYIEKPGRDIRAFVVGGEVIAASYRNAEHWITNVARGAHSTACPVTPELAEIAGHAVAAVGADIAGVDLVETDEGLKVIEVNGGAEFKGIRDTTSLSIADIILDHVTRTIVAPLALESVA